MSGVSLRVLVGSLALVVVLCLAIHWSDDSRIARTLTVLTVVGATAYSLADIRQDIVRWSLHPQQTLTAPAPATPN